MIEINKITKEYADKVLFKDFSTTIYDGEKVGIVGANGSGKTTLMNIIACQEFVDKGSVHAFNSKFGYLKQVSSYHSQDFYELCEQLPKLKEFLKIKSQLGLKTDIDFSKQRLKNLSFGEKVKLMLAKVLCEEPNVLLLDEPTNHLDQEGIEWLIKTIKNLEITVIVISHDRYFLNQVVNKIYEIENGQINEFYGDYDAYELQKNEKLEHEKKEYYEKVEQNKKLEKQVAQLKQNTAQLVRATRRDGSADRRSKGYKDSVQKKVKKLANQVGAKTNRLEKMKQELGEKPFEQKEIYYSLKSGEFGSKTLLTVQNLKKCFDSRVIFENTSFTLNFGDKLAVCGPNGCGKTTLLKILLGKDKDYEGEVWKSPSVKIAYLSQDVLDLDENLTVMQMARQNGKEMTTQFLSNLANMGLTKQVFERKISSLSLGERMRLKLCELILSDYNLLVLDEPTNHLDLPNRVFLEQVLKAYNGTLLVVSHDRLLLSKVCNKFLVFKDQKFEIV